MGIANKVRNSNDNTKPESNKLHLTSFALNASAT